MEKSKFETENVTLTHAEGLPGKSRYASVAVFSVIGTPRRQKLVWTDLDALANALEAEAGH